MRQLTLPEGYDIKVVIQYQYEGEPESVFAMFELYRLKDLEYVGEYQYFLEAIDAAWNHHQNRG